MMMNARRFAVSGGRVRRGRGLALTGALSVLAIAGAPAVADVWYVNAAATPGGDGRSWATAFVDLQDALAAVASRDEVWVAAGTYTPAPSGGSRDASFILPRGVSLYGGFAGTETQRNQRDILANPTVLSGDLNGDDGPLFANRSDNAYHVVRASGAYVFSRLDGFGVRGGHADGSGANAVGGGLLIDGAAPTLANLSIADNFALAEGGGIYAEAAAPVLDRCRVEMNEASTGGGMRVIDGAVLFVDTDFAGNVAGSLGGALSGTLGTYLRFEGGLLEDNSAGDGGGIAIDFDSFLELTDTSLLRNTADALGGGLLLAGDSGAVVAGSTLADNSAVDGAGIALGAGGSFELQSATLSGNVALTDGGGLHLGAEAAVRIDDSSFRDNVAGNMGGGLYADGLNTIGLFFATFLGNSATDAGAVSVADRTSLTIEDSQFVNNTAVDSAGGLYADGSIVTLLRSEMRNNAAGIDGGAALVSGSVVFAVEESNFVGNRGANGGAIFSTGGTRPIEFTSVLFRSNVATESGGAMATVTESRLDLESVQFESNRAGVNGGGLSLTGTPFQIELATFEGNGAGALGGGIYITTEVGSLTTSDFINNTSAVNGGALVVERSPQFQAFDRLRFIGNSASERGGAVQVTSSTPEVEFWNTLFSGNQATIEGGGAFVTDDANVDFINCTFLLNDAGNGRSIAANSPPPTSPSDVSIVNSILWNGGNETFIGDLSSIDTRHSNVEGGLSVGTNISLPPLFIDDFGRLDAGSPSIDSGSNFLVPRDVTVDLDGNPRFVNDPGMPDVGAGSGALVDMGAYEFQGTTVRLDLTISPNPLRAGQAASFTAENGTPGNEAILAYSRYGLGTSLIPQFEVAFDLDLPVQVGGPVTFNGAGVAAWNLNIPSSAAGLNLWFQVAQFRNKSNVVQTSVIR